MMEGETLQRSPSTLSITHSNKLLRLKRSLSFMRSKSVENFFQRSLSDARVPPEFLTDPPPPSPPPGTPLPSDCSTHPSPSVSPKPSLSPTSSSLVTLPRPIQMHCFQEYVFRRPTSCQLCKHVIVGNSKQGLRCKTCKVSAHLWCTSELSQQSCLGKAGMFKRNFSTPLISSEQPSTAKDTPSPDPRVRMDPIYATLRYGTSLAQMNHSSFGSVCESPTHSLGDGGEEKVEGEMELEEGTNEDTENADAPPSENLKTEVEDAIKVPKVHTVHTYVALYKFLPQEPNDLELHPGDRVQVTDDSNEEWWKGKSGDRVGFFPSNFVQRVRPGERVWRVTQGANGNRDLGHMAVKEDQICVGKSEDADGYLKLCSGKKRGLVPTHSLEEI